MSTDNIIPFPSDAVTEKDGEPITTSLRVAEIFGKQHKDVLRALERLECSTAFIGRNFALSAYIDPTGRSLPMYEMTRNGLRLPRNGLYWFQGCQVQGSIHRAV